MPASRLAILVGGALSATGCESGDCTASITPETLPDGRVGQAYFLQLEVALDGADCFRVLGFVEIDRGEKGLPAGMKLSEDGALDGTPLQPGTYRFGVTANYSVGQGRYRSAAESRATTRLYELTILPG